MILWILPIIATLLVHYYIRKSIPIHHKIHTNMPYSSSLRILTQNVQRLPLWVRPSVDIDKLMLEHDIVCLQEDFYPLTGRNSINTKFNFVSPGRFTFKLLNSGLSIYSRYPIEYIDFIPFSVSGSIDSICDKGFLITRINNVIIINVHLQSNYYDDGNKNKYTEIISQQLAQIFEYITHYDKVIIVGDFNMDISLADIDRKYKGYRSEIPTHWGQPQHCLSTETAAYKKKQYKPYYYDGIIITENIKIKSIFSAMHDKLTDHLGVSFELYL